MGEGLGDEVRTGLGVGGSSNLVLDRRIQPILSCPGLWRGHEKDATEFRPTHPDRDPDVRHDHADHEGAQP